MNKLLEMFITFFKIGAFTFGGGWAMLPIMEREFVTTKGWISKEDYVDILAVSQSFPGVLAVNTSTFIGRKLFGFRGALIAVIGVSLPSFLIILLIAIFFRQFRNNDIVDLMMKGINAAVPALIVVATGSLLKTVRKTPYNFAVMFIATALLVTPLILEIAKISFPFPDVHPVVIILGAALLGILKYRHGVVK